MSELAVAMLSHLASPHAPTGAERSLVLLANGLAARRHRVAVTAPGPSAFESQLASNVPLTRIPCRMAWNSHFERDPLWRVAARFLRFVALDPGPAKLEDWMRGVWPDVVYVNCLPHVKGARAARHAGYPVVWHIREILPEGRRRGWFAKQIAASANAVVAVSEAVASWLKDEGLGALLSVVPNGVDAPTSPKSREDARRVLGLPVDGIVAGLFGQVRPHKGVTESIEAVAKARAAAPSLRLVVAGDGPLDFLAEADAAAERHGLGDAYRRFPGLADPSDLFAASDVILLATRTPDPFPRAVLEAMAWGRPVAAFRSGGAGEMIVDGETGFLVDSGDIAGFSAAIARLATDRPLREALGAAGRTRAKLNFSVDAHVTRMEQVFRDVCKR